MQNVSIKPETNLKLTETTWLLIIKKKLKTHDLIKMVIKTRNQFIFKVLSI